MRISCLTSHLQSSFASLAFLCGQTLAVERQTSHKRRGLKRYSNHFLVTTLHSDASARSGLSRDNGSRSARMPPDVARSCRSRWRRRS